jgi:hypothetical protein
MVHLSYRKNIGSKNEHISISEMQAYIKLVAYEKWESLKIQLKIENDEYCDSIYKILSFISS